mmetsp:Transcript_54886/g.177651  ORF Transcript_54886/g.177651 Transcript_54886/m.177651 type:complete len:128 (+) Transcript_54886:104-487(+)
MAVLAASIVAFCAGSISADRRSIRRRIWNEVTDRPNFHETLLVMRPLPVTQQVCFDGGNAQREVLSLWDMLGFEQAPAMHRGTGYADTEVALLRNISDSVHKQLSSCRRARGIVGPEPHKARRSLFA